MSKWTLSGMRALCCALALPWTVLGQEVPLRPGSSEIAIESKVLGEHRPVLVFVPPSYAHTGERYHAVAGTQRGWLRGTPGTNFDLRFYEWNGASRILKKTAATASTNEFIEHTSAITQFYMYKVNSVLGACTFDFWLERP